MVVVCTSNVSPLPTKDHEECPLKKLVVPEDYMHGEEDFIADIVARLQGLKDDQNELDGIYSELLEGLKRSSVVVVTMDRYGSPGSSR